MDKHIIRKLFIVINFGLFFLWGYLLFHGIIYGPDSGQRGVFFGGSDDWFMDFYNVIYFSVGKSPYSWGYSAHRPYLPLSYMILYPLTVFYSYDSLEWGVQYMSRYNQLMAIAGAVYLVISFGILFYCLYKACKNTEIEKIFILAALFCSGITIFNFDRANLIILSAALSCIFLMTYDSGNRLYRHLGFMSLAISAALKLFPALFGVVLLYKKQYKDALFTIIYGLVFAILPFFWLEGSVIENIQLFIQALETHAEAYAHGALGLFSPTIFSSNAFDNGIIPWIICGIALIAAKNARKKWQQILLLSLAIILTSGQQAWYCLIYLFYPIILFLNDEETQKINYLFLIGFVLILSPLQYNFTLAILSFTPWKVINTICIVMYLYLIFDSAILFIKNTLFFDKLKHNEGLS